MKDLITMAHGDGGEAAHKLLREHILPALGRSGESTPLSDAASLPMPQGRLAVTTDSFVIKPLFFPGGDIGKLAVAGTVNDLAVSGARPLYMTVSFILEEGFPIRDLARIASSMALEASKSGVSLVAGDTKVVERGCCDGIYINTSGIGVILPGRELVPEQVRTGDAVLITGPVGDHGIAVVAARNELGLMTGVQSDCGSLSVMLESARDACGAIRMMRDPTRGGLATALVELCEDYGMTIEVDEELIPVRSEVEGACDLLGFDPLYLANEGKAVLVVPGEEAEDVLDALRSHPQGKDACRIGTVTGLSKGQLLAVTPFGSSRRLYRLSGTMLPRIC